MNKKDTVIVIAILAFTLSLSYATYGMGHFLARESYVHALNVEKVVSGGTPSQQSLFYNFAAFAYALTGRQGVGVEELSSVLRLLPGIFAAVAGVSAYFALRLKFSEELAGAAALLMASGLPFASLFMANVVSPSAFAVALFIAGFAVFAYSARKDWRFAVAGGALAGLSMLAAPAAVLAYAALAIGLAAELAYRESNGEKRGAFTYSAATMVLVPLPFALFAGIGSAAALLGMREVALSPNAYLGIAAISGLLLITSLAKLLHRIPMRKLDVFLMTSSLISLALSPFVAVAAVPGVLLGSAFCLRELPTLAKGRKFSLGLVFLGCSFVASAALAPVIPPGTALVFGALIGAAGAFAASMYEGERMGAYLQVAFFAVAAFASLSSAAALAHYQTDPVSEEMQSAFAWLSVNTSASDRIAVTGDAEMAAYLVQRPVENDTAFVARWLLTNASVQELKAHRIAYLAIDGVEAFDSLVALQNASGAGADVRLDSFAIVGITYDEQEAPYLSAYSLAGGKNAYVPIQRTGTGIDATKDAILFDAAGSSRKISAARFIMLKGSDGKLQRVILPYENFNINLFNAFFGNVPGLERAYPAADGAVRVFRVV